ncbi:MFS transporter [Pseudonocardia sp. WMMC193]|uniref:MFS transporter n=1 Tax=Pseudonocardia sp. WMMC193 TaxID=2911965 RepID=UPI00210296BC|nr:MFS transporter [Pseudonocardia sp. WMMC193]
MGGFLGPFGGGITTAMLPELGGSFGISPAAASSSLTAFLLPFAAAMLLSGTLGERWGRVRTVRTAYVVYAVSCVVAVVATSWGVFLGARVLQGLANAFTTPLVMAALAASVAPEALGRALGWYGSLQAAGQTSAPLVGGLAAEVEWHLAFVGVAVVALGLAVVGLPNDDGAATRSPATLRSALRPEVLRLGLVAGLGWGCLGGAGFLVALRLADVFDLDAGPRGLVLTGLGVVGILTARVAGSAVGRFGGRGCVIAGAALGGALLAGVGLVPLVGLVAVLWALAGFPSQLLVVGVNSLVLGGAGTRGGGPISVVQSLRFFGAAASPIALPPVYHADPAAAFLAPAALLVAAVPALVPRKP